MTGTTRERVLATMAERDISLPEDGLTAEKIRKRAFGFQFEADESLSFRIERHPTMYLSDMGLPGLDVSPAQFHRRYEADALTLEVGEEADNR